MTSNRLLSLRHPIEISLMITNDFSSRIQFLLSLDIFFTHDFEWINEFLVCCCSSAYAAVAASIEVISIDSISLILSDVYVYLSTAAALSLPVKAACNMCERAVSWTHLTVIWLLFNIIVAYPAHVPSSFSSPFRCFPLEVTSSLGKYWCCPIYFLFSFRDNFSSASYAL